MALGVGHAGVRVALVVEGGQLDLEAQLGEGAGELLDGELGAILDVVPMADMPPESGLWVAILMLSTKM
jgi:hypothetical protein